ncbi:YraN family protein [Pinirhizobacter sp.]|jgi:putative endonuclease|uniref:YraN family protein n=1 Tax=Pinirhizobacter sp. TaxID=2950432 RepID=UPI002F405C45
MVTRRRLTGDHFETLACLMLEGHGLTCLARNYLTRDGEVDLIMRDGRELVFVEVRYRASNRFGGAAASITPAKRQRIVRAARQFLATQRGYGGVVCRFDVVAYDGAASEPTSQWFRAAFEAGQR